MDTTRQAAPIPLAVKSVDEVAAILNLTPAGVYWLIKQGRILANTVAGKLVVADTEVERLRAARTPLSGTS